MTISPGSTSGSAASSRCGRSNGRETPPTRSKSISARLGRKWSSAQITSYSEAELMGRLVACVVNFPPRNIAGFQSEVLILGAKNARADVILLSPLAEIALGEPVF